MDFLKQLTKVFPQGSVITVVCDQWGDTGKGAIVDRLMPIADICVRSTGADNCGHTSEVEGKKYVTHMIPSGIIFDRSGKVSVISRDVAFNPLTARLELDELTKLGVTHDNLKISFRAKLIMPHHIVMDMVSEYRADRVSKIGTTGRGVGPVFQDHVGRFGLFVMDMLNKDHLRSKLQRVLADKIAFLKTIDLNIVQTIMHSERLESGRFFHSETIFDLEAIVDRYYEHGQYFLHMICDTEAYLSSKIGSSTIVFEGAQGTLLDINQGSYPFVTSSRCTTAGLAYGAGLSEKFVTHSLGVVKAYVTRVGEGAFPTEIGGYNAVGTYQSMRSSLKHIPLVEQLNSVDPIVQGGALGVSGNEFGATTGRPRRTGWMDIPALRYAASINGPKIVVTKLDVLTGIKRLPLCVGYRYVGQDRPYIPLVHGQEITEMIPENCLLTDFEPIYEYVDGWEEDLRQVRSWQDLPVQAKAYLSRIAELSGTEIVMIGVGPSREQVFFADSSKFMKRVYGILVDRNTETVALNIKDSTLPKNLAHFEGLIGLFGGAPKPNETIQMTLERELNEELGLFTNVFNLGESRICYENETMVVFSIPCDLYGNRHKRGRIQELMRNCREGEAVVRTFAFIRQADESLFLPGIKAAILGAID